MNKKFFGMSLLIIMQISLSMDQEKLTPGLEKICSGNRKEYHCNMLYKFLYCACHCPSEMRILTLDQKIFKTKNELKEIANFHQCYGHEPWDFTLPAARRPLRYYNLMYHVKQLGEQNKLTPEQISDEQVAMVQKLTQLAEQSKNQK